MAGATIGFRGAELRLPAELSRLPDARSWADAAAEAFGELGLEFLPRQWLQLVARHR